MRWVLFFMLLVPFGHALDLTDIDFIPLVDGGTVDIYGTSTITHNGEGTNITFRWLADGTVVKTDIVSNPSNGSTIFSAIFQEEYAVGEQLRLNITASNGTATLTLAENVAECLDGRDNDGDGLTDYPEDTGCIAKEDTDESESVNLCTRSTGGGSAPAITTTSTTTASEEDLLPFRNNLLEATKDLFDSEIPCNQIDDDGDGLIDENCPNKNLSLTTDTGAQKFKFFIAPGEIREGRTVQITNFGTEVITADVLCQGGPLCEYVTFDTPRRRVLPSPDLPEQVPFTIEVPLTATQGETQRVTFAAVDPVSGYTDTVLVEVTFRGRIGIITDFLEAYNKPYCVNINKQNAKPVCAYPSYAAIFGMVLIGAALIIRSRKK